MRLRTALSLVGVAALLVVILVRLLIYEFGARHFGDELHNIVAAANLFETGFHNYVGPEVRFKQQLSVGIAASWTSGVGWILGGDLWSARLGFMGLQLFLTVLGFWIGLKRFFGFRPLDAALGALTLYLLTLLIVPYANASSIYVIGEFPGWSYLLLGAVLMGAQPLLGAVLIGLCVWNAKIIYLPFAVALLLPPILARRVRALPLIVAFMSSYLAYLSWIVVASGLSGLWENLSFISHNATSAFMGFSGAKMEGAEAVVKVPLFERLSSPLLEWHRNTFSDRVKVLGCCLLPILLLTVDFIRRWKQQPPRKLSDLFTRSWESQWIRLGLLSGLVLLTLWWFALHAQMFIRHFQPALFVGWTVVIYYALMGARSMSSDWQRRMPALGAVLVVALVGLQLRKLPGFLETRQSPEYAGRYSKFCVRELPRPKFEDFELKCIEADRASE